METHRPKRRRGPYNKTADFECSSTDNFQVFDVDQGSVNHMLPNELRPSNAAHQPLASTATGTNSRDPGTADDVDISGFEVEQSDSEFEVTPPFTHSEVCPGPSEGPSGQCLHAVQQAATTDEPFGETEKRRLASLSNESLDHLLSESMRGATGVSSEEDETPEPSDVYYTADGENEDSCEWFDAEEFMLDDPQDEFTSDAGEAAGDDDDFIYEGASLKVGAFMLLLAVFITTHNMTGAAVSQLLMLLSLALPTGSKICTSLASLRKYVKDIQSPIRIHYFCPVCLAPVDVGSEKCPMSVCSTDLTQEKASFFVEIPLAQQIRTFFCRPRFLQDIKHRFKRTKQCDSAIEDIYDGNLYRSLSGDGGILNDEHNLSLLFNTDGVPVFKSSKVSMWPVFFVVNELPFSKRILRENLLFGGLWCGERKPPMLQFLKPFYESLKDLEQSGLNVNVNGRQVHCKVILLAATSDLPARSMIVNSVQYNGSFGCWKCLQQGRTVKVGPRGHVHSFPYDPNDYKGPPRTKKNAIEDACSNASRPDQQANTKGIKGPCWFSLLVNFDHVRGFGIDYMHGVLLGVQKRLLSLWFDSKYKNEPFSIFSKLSVVESRLLQIKPTLDITRLPRSISEHLTYWKANEYRSFLLYYSLPLLHDIMTNEYFAHYCLFVSSIAILLKSSILPMELTQAEDQLRSFCERFSALYDERYYGLNVHQLLHLTDCVRDLGPMFTHSCFYFESANGFLLKLIRGTQHIEKQIVHAVSYLHKFPELYGKFIEPRSIEDDLYIQMQLPPKPIRTRKIKEDVYMLGSSYQSILSNEVFIALRNFLNSELNSNRMVCFNRVEVKNLLVYATRYKRMVSRCNSAVKVVIRNNVMFALVDFFVLWEGRALAVTKQLYCMNYNGANHISAVQERDSVLIFDVEAIEDLCIYIKFDGASNSFICEFPNRLEKD